MVFAGRLIPYGTHKREMREATESRDAWHEAFIKSEEAREVLEQEVYKLLETARISAKFYTDFFPNIKQDATLSEANDDVLA